MHHLVQQISDWYLQSLDDGGYALVVFLMILESSVVPIPSEVIIPPAVFLAMNQQRMSIAGIVMAGAIGSLIGASLMYWASRWAGRPFVLKFVLKYGRFFFITPAKVEATENWAQRFGLPGVFFSRFLPVVRHLIGIPAGIVRLPFGLYAEYTAVGSALWCAILAWLAVKAHQDQALMNGEIHRVTLWLVAACLILGGAYYTFVYRQMKKSPLAARM